MNPLDWLKDKFSGAAPKGGAIVPVKAGQLRAPDGIQRINTNLNVPGGGATLKGVARKAAPAVVGAVDAGMQIQQGEDPLRAFGRSAAGMVTGSMGAAGAMFVGGEGTPFDMVTAGAGYNEGYKTGTQLYNNAFGAPTKTSTSSGKTRVGGVTYDLSIPEHKAKYDAVIKADRERPGRSQMADLRGGDGLATDGSRLPRGRVTTEKTNSNGVVQKGTQMTPSTLGDIGNMYDRVLDGTGLKSSRYNPFESVSLPTYGASASDAKVMGASDADAKQIASGGAVETLIDGANITSSPYANAIDQVSTEGGQKIVKSGAQKVVKGANGHEFGGDHEAPPTMKRDRTSQLRRKYMLDDNLSSMQALRAMRDAQGFDRHGDGYYAHGSAKPGDTTAATKITKEQYQQAIRSDAGTASVVQDLKDSYVAAAKDVQSPESTTNDYWNERTTKVEDPSAMSATTRQAYELTAPGASFNKDGPVDDNSEQVARDYLKIKKPFRG